MKSYDGPYGKSPFDFSIPFDLETTAVSFFLNNFSSRRGDAQAVHGFMPYLIPIYNASSVKSPVQAATASIAINMMMLFANQGGDSVQARSMYTKAVASLKQGISDPDPTTYNDMIVAVLILDFYEELNSRYLKTAQKTDAHKMGTLALLKHRNSMAIKKNDKIGNFIMAGARSVVCDWAHENGKDLPEDVIAILSDCSAPLTKSDQLDVMGIRLVSLRGRYRILIRDSRRWTDDIDFESWQQLLNDALQLNNQLQEWLDNIPLDWRPLFVTENDIEPSIKKAGFYGTRCAVYKDLAVCDVVNNYRIRRITVLQIIQCCCLHLINTTLGETQRLCIGGIQKLVDEILETVPFHIGNATEDLEPMLPQEITYPYAYRNGVMVPDPKIQYPRQAMATGGWILYSFLRFVHDLTKPSADIITIQLLPSQIKYIKAQMKRVEVVYSMQVLDESLNDMVPPSPVSDSSFTNPMIGFDVPKVNSVKSALLFQQFWSFPMEWKNADDIEKVPTAI